MRYTQTTSKVKALSSYTTIRHSMLDNLPHIRRGQCLDHTCSLAKPCPEDAVRILEHAVLQRDNNELRALESSLDEAADVLCVRQIQRCIDLVKNIHGRRLELEKGHNEG